VASDTYTVERAQTIDAPPERVFEQIADFHRWRAWSPWEDLDPDLQRTYSGAEAGTGAVYAWSGNRKAGQGRMEMTQAVVPSRVEVDLRFEKPFKAQSTTVFAIAPSGDGARVTWTMSGPKTFMVRVMGLFRSMDQMVGKDFEKGLARLKAVAERPAT
jgi:uncharacterized protein YndB with AHSA1/START domain